ncbi:MAG TPA: hypothetical protein VL574_14215 [Stellaceae bacterium]|jgi:hypothetical protein|nr:hypothetical protein [Stellaceae bacterium]
MRPDYRLEGGDYLDFIEQPVLSWSVEEEVGGGVILKATMRADPPRGENEEGRSAVAARNRPSWMGEATIALAMSDDMARALLLSLQRRLTSS